MMLTDRQVEDALAWESLRHEVVDLRASLARSEHLLAGEEVSKVAALRDLLDEAVTIAARHCMAPTPEVGDEFRSPPSETSSGLRLRIVGDARTDADGVERWPVEGFPFGNANVSRRDLTDLGVTLCRAAKA